MAVKSDITQELVYLTGLGTPLAAQNYSARIAAGRGASGGITTYWFEARANRSRSDAMLVLPADDVFLLDTPDRGFVQTEEQFAAEREDWYED